MAVVGRRDLRDRLPPAADDDLRHVERELPLDDERRRARRDCLPRVVVAVVLAARDADEEIAAQDVAAVRADAADLRVAKRCRSFVTDLSQQFAE